jgi:hypothetical protein
MEPLAHGGTIENGNGRSHRNATSGGFGTLECVKKRMKRRDGALNPIRRCDGARATQSGWTRMAFWALVSSVSG